MASYLTTLLGLEKTQEGQYHVQRYGRSTWLTLLQIVLQVRQHREDFVLHDIIILESPVERSMPALANAQVTAPYLELAIVAAEM